jgi:hypothetical protein
MNKVFLLLLFVAISEVSLAQRSEEVLVRLKDGSEVNLEFTLRQYKSKYIFPDDGKDYIRGKVNKKKNDIQKSDIQSITLKDGSIYEVIEEATELGYMKDIMHLRKIWRQLHLICHFSSTGKNTKRANVARS